MAELEDPVDARVDDFTRRVRRRANARPDVGAALASGAAGAVALTAVHQLARRRSPNAPRMDVLGMRAIARGLAGLGIRPPTGERLYRTTLAADLAANALYYSAVALAGRNALQTGAGLGLGAGIGALVLPPVMGLGRPPHAETWSNRLMTVGWYTIGGLVAGAAYRALRNR